MGAGDHRLRDGIRIDPVLATGDRVSKAISHGPLIGRANGEGEDLNDGMDS